MEDSPWDEDPNYSQLRDVEWSRISSEFTNVGYREGITAGKEAALQEGFDTGFAQIGVPLGREVGLARGMMSAALSILSTRAQENSRELEEEVRDVLGKLNQVRFSDIAPRDVEAEEHMKLHLEEEGMEINSATEEQRDMETLEDLLEGLGRQRQQRPTMEDMRVLQREGERIKDKIINK